MAPWLWDKRKAKDFELLDRIFKEAEERMVWYLTLFFCFTCFYYGQLSLTGNGCKIEQKVQKILDKLTSSIILNTETKRVSWSILQPSLLSSVLLASIEKQIPYPTLILALWLSYTYKQSGKMEEEIKFAKSYLSYIKEIRYKSSNIQQFLILKVTFAWYQSILSF